MAESPADKFHAVSCFAYPEKSAFYSTGPHLDSEIVAFQVQVFSLG
jgi:hypothetical protein